MFCDEALNSVEAIAAGELQPDGRIAAHLETCPNCAAALESARALERMLRRRSVPPPPPQFTQRTLGRVRRARWRSEQFLDMGFNVAIVTGVLGVVAAIWLLVDRTGLSAVSRDAIGFFGSGLTVIVQRVAPSLPLYAAATALLATALGIWWWAERGATSDF